MAMDRWPKWIQSPGLKWICKWVFVSLNRDRKVKETSKWSPSDIIWCLQADTYSRYTSAYKELSPPKQNSLWERLWKSSLNHKKVSSNLWAFCRGLFVKVLERLVKVGHPTVLRGFRVVAGNLDKSGEIIWRALSSLRKNIQHGFQAAQGNIRTTSC